MYNSGASASIFQVEHVNYENAQRSVMRASKSMRDTAVCHPAFCPSWEIAAAPPGWLVSWLEHGTNGSSQGGCSFHREKISGWTPQNWNTKTWQLEGHRQGLKKIVLITKDKHQRQFKKQRQRTVSSSVLKDLALANYVTLEKVLSFLLWKLGI